MIHAGAVSLIVACNMQNHEQIAREYLAREFGADAPRGLMPVATFHEQTLEGEGAVTLFSFEAARGGRVENYVVVAGQTQPNYYPDWDLVPDEIYSLHLGTRFMLVLEIQQIAPAELPAAFEEDLLASLARIAPGEAVKDLRLVAGFGMEGQRHAVWRLRLAQEELYVLGGDVPLGVYRRTDLPPHVVYRLHLGKVIRLEEETDDPAG